MQGQVFIVPGDISRLSVDAVAYSTDRRLSGNGLMHEAFAENVRGFAEGFRSLQQNRDDGLARPGQTFWLQLPERRQPFGVVVTVATGRETPLAERSRRVVENTLNTAWEGLRAQGLPPPYQIAVPAFLAGYGGSWRELAATAVPQLEAAFDFVETHPADVSFVTFTESTYHAWTCAREKVRGSRTAAYPCVEVPPVLVEAARKGECALVLGSGMSLGAGLPGWNRVIGEIADQLGIPAEERRPDIDYFLDLAQYYREAGCQPPLEIRMQECFSVKANGALPTVAHYLVSALPSRFFITTNYDDLLENALESARRWPVRVVSDRDVSVTGGLDGCFVVKFHGCASQGGSIVLSRDDYEDIFVHRPAMALLLESLLLNHTFLFLGYSLRDPDFRRINHRIAYMLQDAKRPAFATTFDRLNGYARRQWANKHIELVEFPGENIVEKSRQLNGFLNQLAETVAGGQPGYLGGERENVASSDFPDLWGQLRQVAETVLGRLPPNPLAQKVEIRSYARVLRLFGSLGWRGSSPEELAILFESLAGASCLADGERIEFLVSALQYCEGKDRVDRIRARIARLAETSRANQREP